MFHKRFYILIYVALCMAMSAFVSKAQQLVIDDNELSLSLTLSASKVDVPSDYAIELTPALVTANGDTLRLDSYVFRGSRNAKMHRRQSYFNKSAYVPDLKPGESVHVNHTFSRSEFPEMWHQNGVQLIVEREKTGCCRSEQLSSWQIASVAYAAPSPAKVFKPILNIVEDNAGKAGQLRKDNPVLHHISEYKPYTPERVLRKEKDALFVHFPLDKSDIRRDFDNNGEILDRIVDITRDIMADTTSSVKIIQIIGLASIEGPVDRNSKLAANRAEALKAYICDKLDVPDSIFEVINGGEAWTELRDQIAESTFDGRDAMLEIIDNEKDPNKRETRLRRLDGGRPYEYVRDNMLSDQRNSGYINIYYDYVPDRVAPVINQAVRQINEGKYDSAITALRQVTGDQRSWNPLAIALYQSGNHQEAVEWLRKAAAAGDEDAQQNLMQIENL